MMRSLMIMMKIIKMINSKNIIIKNLRNNKKARMIKLINQNLNYNNKKLVK